TTPPPPRPPLFPYTTLFRSPGLPNVHSHAFQRGLAGLTERRAPGQDSFWSWRELMYRFAERMGPEDLEAVSALAEAVHELAPARSEEHTSELQSPYDLVCRL